MYVLLVKLSTLIAVPIEDILKVMTINTDSLHAEAITVNIDPTKANN